MEAQGRKEKFVALLEQLLVKCDGVKGKLSHRIEIQPSTLTAWLQGKVDPASIETLIFDRIANVAGKSTDKLAEYLGIVEVKKGRNQSQEKLKNLIEEMLSKQSQEQLGNRLGVTQTAISGWINPVKNVAPGKIAITTMAAIALECGWTIERLLIYLGLKNPKTENNPLFKIQTNASVLSLNDRVKLLTWLSNQVQQEITEAKTIDKVIKPKSDRTICVILEIEDLTIASHYTADLLINLQIKPENLTIATIPSLPDSLDNIDLLIFDISNADSPSLALIQDIDFDGDIVVFSTIDLPKDVREAISAKVTDVVMKPIDWQQLKENKYFA